MSETRQVLNEKKIITPLLIAGFFFGILWYKPYVFYPPAEFSRVNVKEYVEAMQLRPISFEQFSEKQITQPPSEEEEKAATGIVDTFIRRMPPSGWVLLYSCSIAYSKKISFNLRELASTLKSFEYEFAWGFLVSTKASGLIDVRISKNILNVIHMNEELRQIISTGIKEWMVNEQTYKGLSDENREEFKKKLQSVVNSLEDYFK